MEMQVHNLVPGTPAWHSYRFGCNNASDAAVMLGCSPHSSRGDLLRLLHSGVPAEFSDYVQKRVVDPGHRFEALARPLAEKILGGEDLGIIVGSIAVPGLKRRLSASLDGLTFMRDTAWEHKRLNDELRNCLVPGCTGAALPKYYRVQMEQQCLVTGCRRVLFMASIWNDQGELVEERHCWYEPDLKLRAEIIAGWIQFEEDLANYAPAPVAPVVVAGVVEALPAVSVQVNGALAITSNLDLFGTKLRLYVEKLPKKPTSDQDFADLDAACKNLEKAEKALVVAETNALASLDNVEKMRRAVADLVELARTTRLDSEKLVDLRKREIKEEQVQRGKDALAKHIAALNVRIGKPYMPPIAADFAGAISGKRTMKSLAEAVDLTLANAKIAANQTAERIIANLKHLRENAAEAGALFPDEKSIVLKEVDDFQALVTARLATEEKRLEAERARIRAEEAAKLQAPIAPAPVAAAPSPQPEAQPRVVPMRSAVPTGSPTLRLGQINERLAPVAVTADGLARLGIQLAATDKNAKLYFEADFTRICDALVSHITGVRDQRQAA